jgi:hypothetical protein
MSRFRQRRMITGGDSMVEVAIMEFPFFAVFYEIVPTSELLFHHVRRDRSGANLRRLPRRAYPFRLSR